MEYRCENCGQPVLEFEDACWHCGWRLSDSASQDQSGERTADSRLTGADLSSLALHATLTLVLLIAALLVMGRLGRWPLVQNSAFQSLGKDWQLITGVNTAFTLSLPATWQWQDVNGRRQETISWPEYEGLFLLGTHPLGALASDLEPLFIALSPDTPGGVPPAIVSVSKSSVLNRLGYEEAARFLEQDGLGVSVARFVEDYDRTHLFVEAETGAADGAFGVLRCHQQFVHGMTESILLSACAPDVHFNVFRPAIETIVKSFQRLMP